MAVFQRSWAWAHGCVVRISSHGSVIPSGGPADLSGGPLDIPSTHPPYTRGSWLTYVVEICTKSCKKEHFSSCEMRFVDNLLNND